jgi:enoyl-[acyl-carrier protein] reductase / trans-2-enoyl-CoA reductase (NAD+)
MIIQPKIRGFICITAHPTGCAAHVQEQIGYVKKQGKVAKAPKRVLVVGASTGYGLSSRIVAAFGGGAQTMGVFFEKPAEADRTGTAGWYNSAAFEAAAQKAGLYAKSFNGDAFSDTMKAEVFAAIKKDWGQVDALVYSLASPRRNNPRTGEQFRSVIKPIGSSFTAQNLDTDRELVSNVTVEPASEDEIRQTVAVMGGEDWQWWVEGLQKEGLLAQGFTTVAYSYIGPEVTWPVYKAGTIGHAKEDCERVQKILSQKLSAIGGHAYVSVNKAVVTQASSAIPVVPLYISLLFKIMKAKGTHEGTIEQIDRLWRQWNNPNLDSSGRIRIDEKEMAADVQATVKKIWPTVTTENLKDLTDFKGYQEDFLKLFGFGIKGVDYTAEVDPLVWVPSVPRPANETTKA